MFAELKSYLGKCSTYSYTFAIKDIHTSEELQLLPSALVCSVDTPTDEDKKDKLDSVALKLGQSMKELVVAIVGIVDEATEDDQKQ